MGFSIKIFLLVALGLIRVPGTIFFHFSEWKTATRSRNEIIQQQVGEKMELIYRSHALRMCGRVCPLRPLHIIVVEEAANRK